MNELIEFLNNLKKEPLKYDPEKSSEGGNFDDAYSYGWEGGEIAGNNAVVTKVLNFIGENKELIK